MGKGEQCLPCINSNECKLDEPCRVQCRGYRASGTVRHKLHRLAAGEMDFREGNQLQKQGKRKERQEIQRYTGRKEKAQKTSVEAALETEYLGSKAVINFELNYDRYDIVRRDGTKKQQEKQVEA